LRRIIVGITLGCLALTGLAAPAAAQTPAGTQDGSASTPEERLAEMERQLAELAAEVARLRAELAESEEKASEKTASEEMASEQESAAPVEPPMQAAAADEAWEVGYKEGGGGFFVRSPDGDFQFRQLGYVQSVASLFHDDFERADAPGDFSIRRARVDWLVDFHDRYQLFIEFDGGPGSVPGSSDFALVEAKLTADVDAAGNYQVVAGKFVSPFSTENLLSSRSQDTVERYAALNSMFLLPALDVQYGAMLRGYFLHRDLEVMAGVFNGNGRANDNLSDDNGDKEVQLKFNYRPNERLKLGLGFDHTNEESQSLQLRGLSFTPWVAVPVHGTRRAVTADFAWSDGPLSLRGEALWADFADAGAQLTGGFLQGARFLSGDSTDGLQALLRLETASLDSDLLSGAAGDRIDAFTLGLNWFWGGNFRLQLDAVGEHYNGLTNLPDDASRVVGEGWKPYLLTELQIKF
jgi:hypothetical protein